MPDTAAVTINDGASTPVAQTYNPRTSQNGRVKWVDAAVTIPENQTTIEAELRVPGGDLKVYQTRLGFNQPHVSDDVVIGNSSAQVILNLHPQSTLAQRKDLRALVANALDNAMYKDMAEKLEGLF